MKKLFEKILHTSIVSSVLLIAFGVSLIVQVETTIVAISYVIGGILVMLGLVAGLSYFRNSKQLERNELDIIYAIVCVVLGIIIIKNPLAIQNTLLMVVGLIIILNSATKLQYSLELKRENSELYLPTIIISVIMAICGIFLMFRPDIASNILGKIVGTLIVLYAILDLATTIIIKNTFKKIDDTVKEATIEEIDNTEIDKKIESKKRKKKNKKEEDNV